MTTLRRLALAAAAVLAAAVPAAAQDILIRIGPDRVPPDRTRPVPGAVRLELRSLDVHTVIKGRVATTAVDQVFFNPSGSQLEGEYIFPLPAAAALEKFSMFVDGVEVMGEVLDADRARGIYENIVRSRRDPALLELLGTRLFRCRVFPIPPRSEKRLKLTWTELLPGDTGTVTYRYPLSNARHGPKPIARATLLAEIEGGRRIASAYSPTHRVDVVRKGERSVKVSWEGRDVRPERDLVLIVQEPAGDLGVSFAAHRPAGEDGHFLLLVAPAVDPDAKPLPRDVVLCVDTSGSMAGEKIEQAKAAMRYAVRSLNPEDRFGLVTFATEPRVFRPSLVEPTGELRAAALAWIDGIQAVGGTAIQDALDTSLGLLKGADVQRPAVLLFATDGLPTIGPRDPQEILDAALAKASDRVRAFPFGVGTDVNTFLLDSLASRLRGARDYVQPGEDIEQRISALVAKTTHPVMTDVRLEIEGVAVHDLHPRVLPDLFRGSELVVLGRYTGEGGSAVIRVKGRFRDGERVFTHEVTFPKVRTEDAHVGRLWAVRRVGHLLDEIRLRGETAEVKAEVLRLARRWGILTPYTSYLVLENERMLDEALGRRSFNRVRRWDGRDSGDTSFDDEPDAEELLDDLAKRETAARATPPTGAAVGGGGSAPAPAETPADMAGGLAVDRSLETKSLAEADSLALSLEKKREADARPAKDALRILDGRSFLLRGAVWVDATLTPADMDAERVVVEAFGDSWMALARKHPELAQAFSLGRVIVRLGGVIYEVQ